jgi:hypothetical protein
MLRGLCTRQSTCIGRLTLTWGKLNVILGFVLFFAIVRWDLKDKRVV